MPGALSVAGFSGARDRCHADIGGPPFIEGAVDAVGPRAGAAADGWSLGDHGIGMAANLTFPVRREQGFSQP
jgi:hypothetical protein